MKILLQVSTTLHLGGSDTKETPKLSDLSGWEQKFWPKDFPLGSKSKVWKNEVTPLSRQIIVDPTKKAS